MSTWWLITYSHVSTSSHHYLSGANPDNRLQSDSCQLNYIVYNDGCLSRSDSSFPIVMSLLSESPMASHLYITSLGSWSVLLPSNLSVQCNVEVRDAFGYEVPSSHFVTGLSYTLTCRCQNVNQAVNFQWRKSNSLLSGEVGASLSLSQLKLSDAGRYTCNVTTNMVYGGSIDVTIQSRH